MHLLCWRFIIIFLFLFIIFVIVIKVLMFLSTLSHYMPQFTLQCHGRRATNEYHFYPSMDKSPDMVGMYACIVHPIYATNYTLLDCYSASADLGSYSGTVGMSWCVIMALGHAPIAMLANWSRSIHRSWHWWCPGIWWNLPCGGVEWTRPRGRTDRMVLCNDINIRI